MIELPALNIQLEIAVPYHVVLTTGMPAGEMSAETVGYVMDMLTEVAAREQLKGELASLLATRRRNEEMLLTRTFEKQIAELRNQRARFDAQVSQRWVGNARRGEPKLSGAQQTQMEAFETQINQVLKAKYEVENGLLLIAWQIDCVQARLTGQPEPPMPEEAKAALDDLELVEDVSFPRPVAA